MNLKNKIKTIYKKAKEQYINSSLYNFFSMHPILKVICITLFAIIALSLSIAVGFYLIMFYILYRITIGKLVNYNKFKKYRKIAKETDFNYSKSTAITKENFVAFDFETTGLEATESDIIEIGAVKFENGKIIDEFNTYVKPIMSKITPITYNINGIGSGDVHDAPTILEILPKFMDFIGDEYIMAHNAEYDTSFLLIAINIYNTVNSTNLKLNNRVIDTLQKSRQIVHDSKNHKLVTLKEYFSISNLEAHSGLDDAIACGKLYLNLQEIWRKNKIEDEIIKRNVSGEQLEKEGMIDAAIELYEKNIELNFDGSHPYWRLAILYRKKKDYENEKRVLDHAIRVFSQLPSDRFDKKTKINKFKTRLDKLQLKYS